jgi:hypothetical protein
LSRIASIIHNRGKSSRLLGEVGNFEIHNCNKMLIIRDDTIILASDIYVEKNAADFNPHDDTNITSSNKRENISITNMRTQTL